MKNVLLTLLTNHWDMVNPGVGKPREKELEDGLWKEIIDAGAKIEAQFQNRQNVCIT